MQYLKGFISAIILLGLFSISSAWINPTQSPPNGNVGAPINVTIDSQKKLGGLTIGTIGTTTVNQSLHAGTLFSVDLDVDGPLWGAGVYSAGPLFASTSLIVGSSTNILVDPETLGLKALMFRSSWDGRNDSIGVQALCGLDGVSCNYFEEDSAIFWNKISDLDIDYDIYFYGAGDPSSNVLITGAPYEEGFLSYKNYPNFSRDSSQIVYLDRELARQKAKKLISNTKNRYSLSWTHPGTMSWTINSLKTDFPQMAEEKRDVKAIIFRTEANISIPNKDPKNENKLWNIALKPTTGSYSDNMLESDLLIGDDRLSDQSVDDVVFPVSFMESYISDASTDYDSSNETFGFSLTLLCLNCAYKDYKPWVNYDVRVYPVGYIAQ